MITYCNHLNKKAPCTVNTTIHSSIANIMNKINKLFNFIHQKSGYFYRGMVKTFPEKIRPGFARLLAWAISTQRYPSPYARTAISHRLSPD